jgi:hypothetical protein
MFIRTALIAFALILPSHAQEKPYKKPVTPAERIAFMGEAVDQKMVGRMKSGKLKVGEKVKVELPIPQPGELTVIAAPDKDEARLDLWIYDDKDKFLGQRTNEYADAIHLVTPADGATKIIVEVTMFACPKASCSWGVNLYAIKVAAPAPVAKPVATPKPAALATPKP